MAFVLNNSAQRQLTKISQGDSILMSILQQATLSNYKVGIRAVIAGVEKVGKTTLACSAPRVLLIPLEQGFSGVSVMHTPLLDSFADVILLLDEIIASVQAKTFAYQSLVFDSATALERLIHDAVVRSDPTYTKGNKKATTMETALGGYGRGHTYANELFGTFLQRCDWLATYGSINILLTCHVFAAKIIDPAFGEYDSWDLLLHSPKNQKAYGKREMLTQWADLVGFLHEPLFVSESEKTDLKRGISSNKGRILAVNRTPGYVAGNRYGVVDDIPIPKAVGWNHLAHHIYTCSGSDFYNRD